MQSSSEASKGAASLSLTFLGLETPALVQTRFRLSLKNKQYTARRGKQQSATATTLREAVSLGSRPDGTAQCRFCYLRLPSTGQHLVGRRHELRLLRDAWASKAVNMMQIIGWAGRGKTALVNHWLAHLAKGGYSGISGVFAWSFYRRSSADHAGSVDEFLDTALFEFGESALRSTSAMEKAERLVKRIRARPTLFILDGVETIQFPPGPERGRLKDPSVSLLLRNLAALNPGLCVLTSKIEITDLASWQGRTCRVVNLPPLSPDQGGELLRILGVHGSMEKLSSTSNQFGGEPLALILLGNQLRIAFRGNVDQSENASLLYQDRAQGGHAERVMAFYKSWFGPGKELALLQLISLFETEVESEGIRALTAPPAILGLTEPLIGMSAVDFLYSFELLVDADLILQNADTSDPAEGRRIETHQIVRDYFRQELRLTNPHAFQEANARLYEYYARKPVKEFPETNTEMAPLYIAIMHACAAGKHASALHGVFQRRLQREGRHDANYATKKLGAISSVLATISSFFNHPFDRPEESLSDEDKSYVLNYAAFLLRAQGRLCESAAAYESSLTIRKQHEQWSPAAIDASSLAEVYAAQGQLAKAQEFADDSITCADLSRDPFWRMVARSTAGQVAHYRGDSSQANKHFHEAESIQVDRQNEYPLLYSVHGYWFFDFLVDQAKACFPCKRAHPSDLDKHATGVGEMLLDRAKRVLQWEESVFKWGLLSSGLWHLAVGRAILLQARSNSKPDLAQAEMYLNEALKRVLRAGQQDYLPHCLLPMADLHLIKRETAIARADIEKAGEIAERYNLILIQADCHMADARLCLAEGKAKDALRKLACCEEIIKRTGYGRLMVELEILREQVGQKQVPGSNIHSSSDQTENEDVRRGEQRNKAAKRGR